jgi:hypothetical protein
MGATVIRKTTAQAWAATKLQFPVTCLEKGDRIVRGRVVMSGTLNVPAAGVTAADQYRFLSTIECERRYRSDGPGLVYLDWPKNGRNVDPTADIAVGAAQPFEYAWPLVIGYDPRCVEPADSAPAVDFFAGKYIDVTFLDPATLVALLLVNAGTTVWVEFDVEPLPEGNVPASVVMNFVEFNGAETELPGGLDYLDVVLVKDTGAAFTDAELGNLRLTADARRHIIESNTRLATLVRKFNVEQAAGAQVRTAATGIGGEAVTAADAPFVQLLSPGSRPFKGTKLHRVKDKLVLYRDGTLAAGAAKVYYRALEIRDEENVRKAGRKLGWRGSRVESKTASKRGVPAFVSSMAAKLK